MKRTILKIGLKARHLCTFLIFAAFSCSQQDPGEYVVTKTDDKITIDGELSEQAWNSANVISEFAYRWDPDRAQPILFRAFHDGNFLYLSYQMVDDVIIAPDSITGEQDLIEQDRVEIYLAPDKTMIEYYCIEMDVKGRKLDYMGKFHRQFDFSWEFDDVVHKGTYTDDGYVVEAAISLKALDALGIIKDDAFYAGIYRADFHYGPDSTVVHVYASWIDSQTEDPDFHVPASLGVFHLAR